MAGIDQLPGGNETLLVVDDHEMIWEFLTEGLQHLGYSVLLAENGSDAVEVYRENLGRVDLVLMDMVMPKAGGQQAFMEIREMDPNAKILLSSGYVNEEDVRTLLELGACGFLPKPLRLAVIAQAVRDVLDGKPLDLYG